MFKVMHVTVMLLSYITADLRSCTHLQHSPVLFFLGQVLFVCVKKMPPKGKGKKKVEDDDDDWEALLEQEISKNEANAPPPPPEPEPEPELEPAKEVG